MENIDVTDRVGKIMSLFEGFAEAYGTYDGTRANEAKGGKLEIKATAKTVRNPVTRELWKEHVEGRKPLGIIPIRDNDTCLWGCIDIDSYDLSFADVMERVEREGLPLVGCRSKSGGIHLFLFLSEPVPAEFVQDRLREMAALIGYGDSEVFPKQRSVALDRGDLGSWLNMPYYNGDETDRYGIKKNGSGMTLVEFLEVAYSKRCDRAFVTDKVFRKRPKDDPDFGDGPPCMQHLAATGFPEGTRNKGLFALATFAKKKYGTRWTDVLEGWNHKYFDPPLPSTEVSGIIKSHEKKDYHYTCKESPLCNHCNSGLCRTRKFGVGGDDDYPIISGLSVLDTDPPLWFLDVGDSRLELTTDELQNYKMFQKVCMERLFVCYRMMKNDTWLAIVAQAMKNVTRIEAPDEVGVIGQFYEVLAEFVTNRHKGEAVEDILLGRPWYDEKVDSHFFRLKDLQDFLERSGFRAYNRAQVTTRLRAIGGDRHFFNIKEKGVSVWFVPNKFKPVPAADVPDIEKEPI